VTRTDAVWLLFGISDGVFKAGGNKQDSTRNKEGAKKE
jgi:hypothetical protein